MHCDASVGPGPPPCALRRWDEAEPVVNAINHEASVLVPYVTCEREGKWEASESLSAGRWCDVSLEKQHSGGRWGCEPCDMSPWCGTRWEEPLTQNSHTWVCGRHSRK